MTLLLESGAAPAQPTLHPRVVCPDCEGDGVIERRACHHSGNCPCGGVEVECGACDGSGRRPCLYCGEPGQQVGPNGKLYCSASCESNSAACEEGDEGPAYGDGGLREQYERAGAMDRWSGDPRW